MHTLQGYFIFAFSENQGILQEVGHIHKFLEEDLPGVDQTASSSVTPTVTYPETGKHIYKSTLVHLLNHDPKLSTDR